MYAGNPGIMPGGSVQSILARHEHAQIREAMRTVEHFQKYMYEDRIKERSGNTIAFKQECAAESPCGGSLRA